MGEYSSQDKSLGVLILAFSNPGLLLVDHIHFQFNGFLFGILILSVLYIRRGHNLSAAVAYCVLLNLKHIFVYVAPLYFVYLLRNHCFPPKSLSYVGWEQFEKNVKHTGRQFNLWNFVALAFCVIIVFGLSFGPFLILETKQLGQIFRRLFPFDNRGLTHAYWAPNIWALYSTIDVALGRFFLPDSGNFPSSTRGLVENSNFRILPSINPVYCFVLTFLTMLPVIYSVFRRFCSFVIFVCIMS